MSLIDTFLPHHQFSERHQTTVHCELGKLLDIIQGFQPPKDRVGEIAMLVRQLPATLMHWMARGTETGKSSVASSGKFWQLWTGDFGLVAIPGPVEFLACNPPKTAKLVIGFSAEAVGAQTLLTTETRVYCPDRYSLIMFTPYWLAIRPVSGLLRRRALGAIRRIAEA
jgi:hypothetical protein